MKIQMLFKFGKREHLEDTRSKGRLRLGTFEEYRKSENSEVRDVNEGAHRIFNSTDTRLTMLEPSSLSPIASGFFENVTVREFSETAEHSRIYCMYSKLIDLTKEVPLSEVLDIELIKRFGYESVLVIAPVDKFYERLDKHFSLNDYAYKRSLVEYEDLSQGRKDLTPFIKDLYFKNQNEYRVCIQNMRGGKPTFINIGSLEDISQVVDVSKLYELNLTLITAEN